MFKFWCHKLFFHTSFFFLMNNALFVIHSIIHSIVQRNYSFKEFIHSKKHANYSFKDFIHSKKIQNNSFKKFIHSRKSKIIHSKKIFIQVKNGLSPMATHRDIWDTDYNTDNWEPGFMTIFDIWLWHWTAFTILAMFCRNSPNSH